MIKMHIVIVFLSTVILACDIHERASRQIPTFADLFNTSKEIEVIVAAKGGISIAEAYGVIKKRNAGLDSWGNPIVFYSRPDPNFSFLLISLGRDGSLDVDHMDVYFGWPQEDIVGDFDRDIVFRDGKPVTIASAK